MQNVKIIAGNIITMKKSHPCGSFTFKVVRTGSDVRIICTSCSRDITMSRVDLEKRIKK